MTTVCMIAKCGRTFIGQHDDRLYEASDNPRSNGTEPKMGCVNTPPGGNMLSAGGL